MGMGWDPSHPWWDGCSAQEHPAPRSPLRTRVEKMLRDGGPTLLPSPPLQTTVLHPSHSMKLVTPTDLLASPGPHRTWACSWRERESSSFSWAASFSCSPSSSSCSRSFSSCRCAMEAITFWITGKGRAAGRLARFPPQSLPPAVEAKMEPVRIRPSRWGTGCQLQEESPGAAVEMGRREAGLAEVPQRAVTCREVYPECHGAGWAHGGALAG